MRAIVREAQRLRSILRGPHDHAALTRAIGDTVLAIALHLADGDTSPAAVSSRPAGRGALAPRPGDRPGGRVRPATDEDIADDEAMCLSDEPLDWDEECTREAVLSLIARAEKAEREIARLWPVVDNLSEQAIAVADCHGSTTCPCRKRLRALVDDYRAARKEDGARAVRVIIDEEQEEA